MVIATDGRATFAAFNYVNHQKLAEAEPTIGFFGNRETYLDLDISSLKSTNIFRIDGKDEEYIFKMTC